MFEWKKLGRIFDPTSLGSNSWMKEYAQSPSVIIFEKYVRVYFCTRPAVEDNGQYKSYIGYVDLNRKNLCELTGVCNEPIMQLGDLGTFDEFGTNPVSAIRDGENVRAYYVGWTRCESVPFNGAIGLAISKDNGNTFSRIGPGPVLSYTIEEPFVIGSPRIRKFNNHWYLNYAAGNNWIKNDGKPEPVYKIRMAYSDDGINWKKHGKDLIENKLEENECQASPDIFYWKEKYHMFFCYRYNLGFKNKERGYRIGYAISDDLVNWIRDDSKAGIDISEEGWDSEMVSYPHVFELDDKIYMLYQGNEIGRYGFGLAELVIK